MPESDTEPRWAVEPLHPDDEAPETYEVEDTDVNTGDPITRIPVDSCDGEGRPTDEDDEEKG
jgi:hypothetical protein